MKIPIVHFNDVADGEPPPALPPAPRPIAGLDFEAMRIGQGRWANSSISTRLKVIRAFRHALVANATSLVRTMNPRNEAQAAEMLSAQIIPLADACRFLEREAERLLRPRRVVGSAPLWLSGTRTEIHREPFGIVLVIAPSNYPLFLPAVTALQALAAGNAVVLKPAPGCSAVAELYLTLLHESGLDRSLTLLLGEEANAVSDALQARVDKVVFTGSANTGRKVLNACAERLVPAVVELSGSDAMFVRADADLRLAAQALRFGLRLNRGATCIAPRRIFVHQSRTAEFEAECSSLFAAEESWPLSAKDGCRIAPLIVEAAAHGARVMHGEVDHHGTVTAPLLVADAKTSLRLMREDHFGPVAALIAVENDEEALALNQQCPFALGASVFSRDASAAIDFALRVNAGSVVINDVIVPTADPRVPFGGRKNSGFGLTRGVEGLLELTQAKVVITRRGRWRPHYEAARPDDPEFFSNFLTLTHGSSWNQRIKAALALIGAARTRR